MNCLENVLIYYQYLIIGHQQYGAKTQKQKDHGDHIYPTQDIGDSKKKNIVCDLIKGK